VVSVLDGFGAFAALQSSIHEIWVRMMTSTLEDRLRYAPTDCFETFPFPHNYETNKALESIGREYYEFRAALMCKTKKGLTKTYNCFHDKYEQSTEIKKLRTLHDSMDRAVLDAYGWTDIQPVADFELEHARSADADEETVSSKGKKRKGKAKDKYRRRWPEQDRDDILYRLLMLNGEYASVAPSLKIAEPTEEDEDFDDFESESEEDDEEDE
jgi:hypothetical protein